MLSPAQRKDKLIRGTDLDALSCRNSANIKGYFDPPDSFIRDILASYSSNLQFCHGYTQLSAGRTLRSSFSEGKLPLINRGTYFRTRALERLVRGFISNNPGGCQVVSLGGGSDTRAFRILEEFPEKVSYTEVDFPESTKVKKLAIAKSSPLQQIVKCQLSAPEIHSRQQFDQLDPDVHSPNYHLIGLDLRNLSSTTFSCLDAKTPTLVISECVLCYLTPRENIDILSVCKSYFNTLSVVMYEPMGLEDAFGSTMDQNLTSRGIDLHTFREYPDLTSRKHFFIDKMGFQSARLSDMADVGGYSDAKLTWLSTSEQARVSKLEMIDEVEEIRLLLRHYCLIFAHSETMPEWVNTMPWRM